MSRRAYVAVRLACAALGAALTLTGVYFLLTTEPPAALVGLAVWLVAAVVLHDAVFSPAVYLANRLLVRATAGLASVAATTVRVLFAIGAVLTLVVLPEAVAQGRPHANPTILVGDYAERLGAVWSVIVLVIAVVITWTIVRIRRTSCHRRSTRE